MAKDLTNDHEFLRVAAEMNGENVPFTSAVIDRLIDLAKEGVDKRVLQPSVRLFELNTMDKLNKIEYLLKTLESNFELKEKELEVMYREKERELQKLDKDKDKVIQELLAERDYYSRQCDIHMDIMAQLKEEATNMLNILWFYAKRDNYTRIFGKLSEIQKDNGEQARDYLTRKGEFE